MGMKWDGKRVLVFPACVHEHQFPITEKMVISSVVYDQRVLPIIDTLHQKGKKRNITQRDTYPDATTGTYAGRWTPPRAEMYSKCA